jgi:lipocalin
MTESQPITKKLQQLEEYITSLVESLQRGEIPMGLQPVRSVFDRIHSEESPQLQLPPQKFCDLYNDLPNVLDAYAIEVTLNAESHSQNNAQQITFDRFNNGNYWIIAIAAKPLHYWLVPNPTRRINLTRLNSLQFIFDWTDQEHTTKQDTFKLIEPAEVVALPTAPLSWKLIKRGSISTFLNADARAHQRAFRSMPALDSEEIDDITNRLRTELTESIMIELLSLNSKIKSIEDDQLRKNSELLFKSSAIEKEIQVIKAALVDAGSFLGQQNSVNQQLSDQLLEFRQKIEKLIHEKQQQVDEVNIIKSLFNRLNQTEESSDAHTIKKAVQNINSFLEQQNLVNQSVSVYIQSIDKRLEKYEGGIQGLDRKSQQQDKEIQILISTLADQNVNNAISTNHFSITSTSEEEVNFLRGYNSNFQIILDSIQGQAINVSVDINTFARLVDGNESDVFFEPNRQGNYSIFTQDKHYYLVPIKKRRVTNQSYVVTRAIYKCDGYKESYKDFRLIKPALVSKESDECWKLSQKGILEFT